MVAIDYGLKRAMLQYLVDLVYRKNPDALGFTDELADVHQMVSMDLQAIKTLFLKPIPLQRYMY